MALRPDFCTADSHWFHTNIVKYQDRPYEHDAIMLKRWRAAVKDTHTVLHLGDLFFGRQQGYERFAEEIAPKLTGTRYIILGNHDKPKTDYEAIGFTVIAPYSIEYRDFTVSFDHYPRFIHDQEKRLHLHGHVHRFYAHGESARPNNINCCVEVRDYTPQRFTGLVDAAIAERKNRKPYYNSKSFRQAKSMNSRRRAA